MEPAPPPVMPASHARGWRRVAWAALALGIALRAYPLHVRYLQPEVDVPTGTAIQEIVRRDWQPLYLYHGTAFVYALRVLYTGVYAAGRVTGAFDDRLDLLASFVRDPFPYVLLGRALMLVLATLGLVLAARLGARVGDGATAAGAALLAGVVFVHVRESHYVWYDTPATTAVVATVAAGLRALRTARFRDVLLTAALGGAALGTKHSVFPVAAPVLATACLAGDLPLRRRVGWIAGAGGAALAAYAVCSPYTFLDFRTFLDAAWFTAAATSGAAGSRALPLPVLWRTVVGSGITALAVVGLVAVLYQRWREGVVLVAFPVTYVAVLATEGRLHARYLTPPALLVAVLAAVGARTLARAIVPRFAGCATAFLLAAAAAVPAVQSARFDAVLARADTRVLAGEWIESHVPPGTRLTLPSLNLHPNPVLPPDETFVRLTYRPWADVLLARGVARDGQRFPRRFLGGVFGGFDPAWQPQDRFVVMAEHPVVVQAARAPDVYVDRLRAAGAHVVAEFRGFETPLTATYDPIDANYVPLAGFPCIVRPGPNITIWELP